MYSEKVKELFRNPRHMGKPEEYDVVGKEGNLACGDLMHVYVRFVGGKIVEAGFKTMGCAAAISSTEMVCQMVEGEDIEKIKEITMKDVVRELGGLPSNKIHCASMALDALKKAVKEYENQV